MKNDRKMVIRHFRDAFTRENPSHLLKSYRDLARSLHKKKESLKRETNRKRWNPLSPITMRSYGRQIEEYERELRAMKGAIKALVDQGCLGNKKPRRNLISLEDTRIRKQNESPQRRSLVAFWT
jgi:hypothetical protein